MEQKSKIETIYFGKESYEIILFREFNSELMVSWKKLEESNDIFIFQRYSWNSYWYKIFCSFYNFYIVMVQKEEIPVAILPFCINISGPIKILQFIGGDQADYLTPILSDNCIIPSSDWKKLLKIIPSTYDIIQLDKIPEYIKEKRNIFLNIIKAKHRGLSFGLKLPDNIFDFENGLRKSFKNDNKRNLKRLTELGEIKFEKVSCDLDKHSEFDRYIEISLEQKARRIRNYMGNKLLEDEAVREFYRKSYSLLDTNIQLDYTILTLNSSTILATHWGFFDKYRYYFLFPTMEGRIWYRYSCGKILIDFLVKESIKNHRHYFDFTIGDENYKKDWCNHQIKIFTYQKSITFKGFLFLSINEIKDYIKSNDFFKSVWRNFKLKLVEKRKRR
jgi:CelD/BcsL family acetyltransferase involved in cellulose biosynthesis